MTSLINNPTLVLNKNLDAICVEPFKNTLSKVFKNRAKFIDDETYQHLSWEEWFNLFSVPIEDKEDYGYNLWINANKVKIRLPEIVVLLEYNKIPHTRVRLTRRNLLIRDLFRCQYTGKKVTSRTGTIDHILPKCRGGKTEWPNVVISTFGVNVKKGNRTPQEAGLKLLKKPKEPHWHPLYAYADKYKPESWKKFVNTDKWNEIGYWDVTLLP